MQTEKTGNKSFIQSAAHSMGLGQSQLESFVDEYSERLVLYRSAIREISTRLEVLDDEFSFRHRRNPIHSTQSRLKSPQSMLEKMGRRQLPLSMDVICNKMIDIAGIRVICSYVDDIYLLADLLCAQDGIELVRANDYIRRPKANGYRSLHLVLKVPVRFSAGVQMVPVEIQIRTIAMDFWASLEHELHYKTAAKVTKDIVQELKDCAESIAILDERMQKINKQLEKLDSQGQPGAKGAQRKEK